MIIYNGTLLSESDNNSDGGNGGCVWLNAWKWYVLWRLPVLQKLLPLIVVKVNFVKSNG